MIGQIDGIGQVGLDSGDAIAAARQAYDALNDSQKEKVTNYDVLTAAEVALEALEQEQASAQKAADEAHAYADAAKAAAQQAQTAGENAQTAADAAAQVDYMIENGYMKGVSDTLFDAEGSVTRAQMVTILYRIEGESSGEGMENPFEDVADDTWYTDAVIWAANEGVVKGVSETAFDPEADITREQIVTILYRYDGEDAVSEDRLADYTDVDKISGYAKAAMNWAIANEIVNGVTETMLAPADTATRAQICAIMTRHLER